MCWWGVPNSVALLDDEVRRIIKNPNMLVPWWLLAAYAYDQLDDPLISDALFDEIAKRLTNEWATIKHPHKKLLDKTMLKSALAIKGGKWPLIVRDTAYKLINEGIVVKEDYQLTIHHTDGSWRTITLQGETKDRVQVSVVKTLIEGYRYEDGDEEIFVSPYGISKVAVKKISKPKAVEAKGEVNPPANENTEVKNKKNGTKSTKPAAAPKRSSSKGKPRTKK